MSNLQRKYKQVPDISIYEPECAVHSPELIRSWVHSLDACPEFCERLADGFFKLIPNYYAREDGTFPDPPEFWQRNLLSHSFYFGLGVTIFLINPSFKQLFCKLGIVEPQSDCWG